MAQMGAGDRALVRRRLQEAWNVVWESTGTMTKADIRAAVDAADEWVDDNTSSYNTALPNPFKQEATAEQKARLLMFIVARRYEVGA